MRYSKAASVVVLIALGLALALANVWFAAARSLIPLTIEGRIAAKDRLPEKHVGVDDVYLLRFDSGEILQVDDRVFDAVAIGDSLSKSPWSRELSVAGQTVELTWSADVRGMLFVMPLAVIAMLALAWAGWQRPP